MLKKVICLIGFFFITQSIECQLIPERILIPAIGRSNEEFIVGKIAITAPVYKSLEDYFRITDTIDILQNTSDLVKVEGCIFQFNVIIHRDSTVYSSRSGNKTLKLESCISPYQFWEYDITDLSNFEVASVAQELRVKPYHKPVLSTSSSQSCISYALEGIFRSHGINPEPFFFRRSNLADHIDAEAVLKNLFLKVETLDNIKRKTLKKSKYLHEEQVLILFRNIKGEPMHACFNLYGRTWTKNGLMPYMSYPSPKAVIDIYNGKKRIKSDYSEHTVELLRLSTVSKIEIYKLNCEIFE